jgi:hypothetical protein
MSDANPVDGIPYDKAKWHYDGDYPQDVPIENAYVFGGFFFGWVADRGLVDATFAVGAAKEIALFRKREMTASRLYQILGGSLANDMLNTVANLFATDYVGHQRYWTDYCCVFHRCPSPYHVEDSWQNYERICRVIDQAFREWKSAHGSREE